MKILLINPPNCGKSIPEERYGIDSLRQIFKGEPLALEVLAGNLAGHDLRLVDLKVDPGGLDEALHQFRPELVAITGVTCEANTMKKIACQVKESCGAVVVAGGIHASNDPEFFNCKEIDYVVVGLGKASFAELTGILANGDAPGTIPGVAPTTPGSPLKWQPRLFDNRDLVESRPPRYDLVSRYRDSYVLSSLGIRLGFVASAFGCPFDCAFCCIGPLTGGRYLNNSIDSVVRDIQLLGDIPAVRLVDANTFADTGHAIALADAIVAAGIRKSFIADVRSDTVVRHPELLRTWKAAGLRSVVIGFEEISDNTLAGMNKANTVAMNNAAIDILHDMGLTIVGDFIISPDYDEADFDSLGSYIHDRKIDLPIMTVLTPLPGTALHQELSGKITLHDLDYYTLTNAVIPTHLSEKRFYEKYADLTKSAHAGARL